MNRTFEIDDAYFVEVWFPIEKDKEGYPSSKNWEQLLARPVINRDDYFRIESIPFFMKSISRGDIVKAKVGNRADMQEGDIFEFDGVVDRGGHNTYRLLLKIKHPKDPEFTSDELTKRGLAIEQEYGDFFAVDVPPSVDQKAIDEYLVAEAKAGRWELQDGRLHDMNARAIGKE